MASIRVLVDEGESWSEFLVDEHGDPSFVQSCPPWEANETSLDLLDTLLAEHQRVIVECPEEDVLGDHLLLRMSEAQERHPGSTLHIHKAKSFRAAFGLGFRAADMDFQRDAAAGIVHLLTGAIIGQAGSLEAHRQIRALGFKVSDIGAVWRKTLHNLCSARWAALHWNDDNAWKHSVTYDESLLPGLSEGVIPEGKEAHKQGFTSGGKEPWPGDKLHCDSCQHARKCHVYRAGSVCALRSKESKELIAHFKSRDSGKIIDGLGMVLEDGVTRYQLATEYEDLEQGPDPEINKLGNAIFTQGEKLAKLVDPSLRSAAVQIQMNSFGAAQITTGQNKAQQTALAVQDLEAMGLERGDMTPELLRLYREDPKSEEVERRVQAALDKRALTAGSDDDVVDAEIVGDEA